MYSEVTSVYVPVKTPDYKTWAILLSILVHGVLLASLLFFYRSPPPPPMETTLITREQLSEIQGQIKANQQSTAAQAGESAAATSMSDMLSNVAKPAQRDPKTAQMMDDIAAKEAAWQKEQAKIAEQLDKEVAQEQQQVIDQLNAEQAAEQQALAEHHDAEASIDEIKKQLAKDAEAYNKAALPESKSETPVNMGKPISITGGGKSSSQGGDSSPSRAGNKSGGSSANYISTVMSIIDSHWNVPSNSMGKSLVASFSVASDGTITNISIESAGDETFKASLRQAIASSSPLPPPPNGARTIKGRFTAD